MLAASRAWRSRVISGAVAGLATIIVGVGLTLAAPSTLAIPVLMAPGLAVTVATVAFVSLTPENGPPREIMFAALEPRRLWSFAPLRAVTGVGFLGVFTMVLATSVGIASASRGWFAFGLSTPPATTTAAVLATAAALIVSAVAGMWRISSRTAAADPELVDADFSFRALASRLVLASHGAAMAGYLSFVSGPTGGSLSDWADVSNLDGRPDGLASAIAPILEPLGLVSAVVCLVLIVTSAQIVVSLLRLSAVPTDASTTWSSVA